MSKTVLTEIVVCIQSSVDFGVGFSHLPLLLQPNGLVLRVSGPSGTQYGTNLESTVGELAEIFPLLQREMPFCLRKWVAEYSQNHNELPF